VKLEEALEARPPRPRVPRVGGRDGDSPFAGPLGIIFAVAIAATLVAAVVLRFVAKSPLWEDEALTVAIARRPLGQLHTLLRHDGSPPLYYVLLHAWMKVFGTGNRSARALSGVFGVLTIPAAYLVGRRIAGADAVRRQWVAWASVLVVATSPYAFRYSTEVRMYELETLLVLVGYLVVANAWESPGLGWLVGVAAVTAALIYTQYWALYLLFVVGVALLFFGRREGRGSPAWRILVAMAVGCVTFVPWLPTFLYQSRHTATPWAERINPLMASFRLALGFAGQRGVAAYTLVTAFFALGALALFGVALDAHRTELDWRTRPPTRWPAYVFAGTVGIGLCLAYVGTGAAAIRYPSIVFGLFAVVVAYGVVAFGSRLPRYGALAIVVVCGLIGGYHNSTRARTQARQIAAAINAGAHTGDVVVYCPDQLGLDGWRLMTPVVTQYAFPTLGNPEIVNWVDYEQRNQVFHEPGVTGNLADPATFASEILHRAGDHTIWYVFSDGYRTFGTKCGDMVAEFRKARPSGQRLVKEDLTVFESENLYRFSP
jgi:mannosyltransferase